jgi:hypothetical protein
MGSDLLLAVVLGLIAVEGDDDPAPADLVTRLGSPQFADREKAGEALVKLGLPVLPALKKACDSGDLEIRRRSETLVARIEAGELLNATRVKLDIHDRPLAEAAEEIAKASGMRIRPGLNGQDRRVDPNWPQTRVTLQSAQPVPFWDVVDRLCEAGKLHRQIPQNFGTSFLFEPPFFGLALVPGTAGPPAIDSGAFRIELLRVQCRRERDYGNGLSDLEHVEFGAIAPKRDPASGAVERSSYTADLVVSAEPRLRILTVGDVVDAKAIDDQGRSLLKTLSAEEERQQLAHRRMNPHLDPALQPQLRYGAVSHPSTGAWRFSLALSYPSPPAKRIALLRGVVPLIAIGRRPDPVVVELKDADGKQFSSGSNVITVHKVDARSSRQPTVEFTLKTAEPPGDENMVAYDAKGTRLNIRRPTDLMELRLEVVDRQGNGLFWQFTRSPSERTQGRMAIVVHGRNGQEVRAENLRLRYWDVIAAAADIPFVFKDVPTP